MINKIIIYIRAFFLVLIIERRLKKEGFNYLYKKYLKPISLPKVRKLDQSDKKYIENVIVAVDKVCFMFFKNARCLHNSVAAYHIFEKKGIPMDLVIGVRKKPFYSHAWIEYNGHVINDWKENLEGLHIQFNTNDYRKEDI